MRERSSLVSTMEGVFGHVGLDLSKRLVDDVNQRPNEVDDAPVTIPALGLSTGLSVTL